MLQLRPDGTGEITILGQDIASGMRLQHLVPAGVWQGSRLLEGGEFALLGTTVSPGFEYEDFEAGLLPGRPGRALSPICISDCFAYSLKSHAWIEEQRCRQRAKI